MRSSSFKDLKVWQKAMDLTEEIYAISKKLPREELYALSDQIRRAVISIPSNIAEGHGRNTNKDFVHFLSIAKGSLHEVETQLEIMKRLRYINSTEDLSASSLIRELDKMLNSLIAYHLKP